MNYDPEGMSWIFGALWWGFFLGGYILHLIYCWWTGKPAPTP